jgi:hypothetical protein
MTDREMQFLRQSVTELRRELAIRPVRIPPRGGAGSAPRQLLLSIIGGNDLGSGAQGIKYTPSLTLPVGYDPDVDAVYPNGMGRAALYVNGVLQPNNVLVRHDFVGWTGPLLAGYLLPVLGTISIVISPVPTPPLPPTNTLYTVKVY